MYLISALVRLCVIGMQSKSKSKRVGTFFLNATASQQRSIPSCNLCMCVCKRAMEQIEK